MATPNDFPSPIPGAEAQTTQLPDFVAVVGELLGEGERLVRSLTEGIGSDPKLIEGLVRSGTPFKEWLRHSNRFAILGGDPQRLFNRSQPVVIPEGPDNLTQLGALRHEETGYRLDMDYVRESGVDPSKVLYFRATQPGGPKPEYYWTSDINEAKRELRGELGPQDTTAIVLVSTLEAISHDDGLMNDINDDSGVAVRQIGLDAFDQNEALLTLDRQAGM